MFNRKSSYALNKKDPNAIVYMDANDTIIRLTCKDFASEEEFLKWKSLSDADYHASEKEAHVYANHTLALDELWTKDGGNNGVKIIVQKFGFVQMVEKIAPHALAFTCAWGATVRKSIQEMSTGCLPDFEKDNSR